MIVRKLLAFLWVFLLVTVSLRVSGQRCTTLGQTPATAFPVCGSNVFKQANAPICDDGAVPVPARGADYFAYNPYWYKFTCFSSGTLGLLITPENSGDDYDWQIYDITGQPLDAVYTNVNLVVADNWSGVVGNTGTSASANAYSECESTNFVNPPPFSKMPTLIQG